MSSSLQEGQAAPDFSTPTQDGDNISLKQLKGKFVVLYFYPRDDTPGCTVEACGFRDSSEPLRKAGAVVLGVSPDDVDSHKKFARKFKLPFPLLADEKKKVIEDYGVWGEKQFMGKTHMGVLRTTFLIDPDGKIKKIWSKVKPDGHAAEVLAEIQQAKK